MPTPYCSYKHTRFNISTLAAFVAFFGILFCAQSHAQTKTNQSPSFKVGGVDITIPQPTGELVEMGDYRKMAEVFVPDSNRLIAAFLLPDDLKAYQGGNRVGLRRYALVEVQRSSEFSDFSAADFQNAAASVDKQFVSAPDSAAMESMTKEAEENLNRNLKALNQNEASVALNKPTILGRFFSKPDAYCFGMVMPVSGNGSTVKLIVGIMIMRVKNRAFFVYLYSEYKGDETVQWVRNMTESWAQAMLTENAK